MKILAIETSTKCFSLAVADGNKVIRHREVVLKKVLSDSIIPAIQKILKEARVPLAGLDGFAVGLGPGSFTSLRVGMATVKALAFSTGKPVVGRPSLDLIAYNVIDQDFDEICVIADARRNLLYAAIYQKDGQRLKQTADYQLIDLEKLLDQVNGKTLFVGDGIGLFRAQIEQIYAQAAKEKSTGCQAVFADERFWFPKAAVLAQLAMERFEKGQFDKVDKLTPLYLYPMDCQVGSGVKKSKGQEVTRSVENRG